jgi:hypothetical protein
MSKNRFQIPSELNSNTKKFIFFFIVLILISKLIEYFNEKSRIQYFQLKEAKKEKSFEKKQPTPSNLNNTISYDIDQLINTEKTRCYIFIPIEKNEFTSELHINKMEGVFSYARFSEMGVWEANNEQTEFSINRKGIYKNGSPFGKFVNIYFDLFFKNYKVSFENTFGIRENIELTEKNFKLKYPRYIWSFKIENNIYDIH